LKYGGGLACHHILEMIEGGADAVAIGAFTKQQSW
jgi:hypothetical protein